MGGERVPCPIRDALRAAKLLVAGGVESLPEDGVLLGLSSAGHCDANVEVSQRAVDEAAVPRGEVRAGVAPLSFLAGAGDEVAVARGADKDAVVARGRGREPLAGGDGDLLALGARGKVHPGEGFLGEAGPVVLDGRLFVNVLDIAGGEVAGPDIVGGLSRGLLKVGREAVRLDMVLEAGMADNHVWHSIVLWTIPLSAFASLGSIGAPAVRNSAPMEEEADEVLNASRGEGIAEKMVLDAGLAEPADPRLVIVADLASEVMLEAGADEMVLVAL